MRSLFWRRLMGSMDDSIDCSLTRNHLSVENGNFDYISAVRYPVMQFNSADSPYLSHRSLIQFLNLRLVSKAWSLAIPTFLDGCLQLQYPWAKGFLVRMWGSCMNLSVRPPLRQLCLDGIMYFPASKIDALNGLLGVSNANYEYEFQHYETNSCYMEDVADILSLCGSGLVDLKLSFTGSVGFASGFVESITRLKNLKVLNIHSPRGDYHINDPESVMEVLNNLPTLESLTLDFMPIRSLRFRPGSLSNLLHLWVACHDSTMASIVNLIRTASKSIKFLEYVVLADPELASLLVWELLDSLEVVFFESVPDGIPSDIYLLDMPKLRVVRTLFVNPYDASSAWLRGPIFQSVELFITCYVNTSSYWRDALSHPGYSLQHYAPKIKHFIFLTGSGHCVEDLNLVRLFNAQGVTCVMQEGLCHKEVLNYLSNASEDVA